MRLVGLGHAGLRIETKAGVVLCDPWLTPAYFGSWFPFPDNSDLDWERLGQADYLYVSHLHSDHFDPAALRRYVSRAVTVLLPDFPTDELRQALADLGYQRFLRLRPGEIADLGGLRVMAHPVLAPSEGSMGDSALWLSDGVTTVLNQNDARPPDMSVFAALGPVDVHLLQYSGAMWYPMVYELPERAKRAFGARKRAQQFERAARYIDDVNARFVFPNAGPPCFLDPQLWHLNDIFDDPGNIFPDQSVFLRFMTARGRDNLRLLLPGSVAEPTRPGCPVTHQVEPSTVFAGKAAYLRAYQARQRADGIERKDAWGVPGMELLAAVRARFEPLLACCDRIAEGIGGPVRLTATSPERGTVDMVLDFVTREVREYAGEKARYRFRADRALVERLIADEHVDWVNSLFLSCRFTASRVGAYNDYLYTFFKSLSPQRLRCAEQWYAERSTDPDDVVLGGWVVARRCPHAQADLTTFGEVADGVLTCQMHGWRWRLSDGRCLTSTGHPLRAGRQRDGDGQSAIRHSPARGGPCDTEPVTAIPGVDRPRRGGDGN